MSIFSIFRKKTISNNQDINSLKEDSSMLVDRNLFVEDKAPTADQFNTVKPNPVELFLNQNYEFEGYKEGYAHPDAEFLELKIRLIRSNFLLAVDKAMDARRLELGEIRLHLIDVDGISPRLEAKLREKISQIEVTIHELDMQKILSVEDNGLISNAINAYRLGFIKGLEQYQIEKVFAGSTGLFNN